MRKLIGACLLAGSLAAIGTPAMASPNSYGGYDIAGPYQANESFYGAARGWDIYKSHDVNRNAYCVAVNTRNGGNQVRIGWDGLQWQVAVPVPSSPEWEGTLQIDGSGSGRGYLSGSDKVFGTSNSGWSIAQLGMAELDGIQKGGVAVLGIGRADYDFSLSGSSAAILKVEECFNNGGIAPAVSAAPPPPPPPPPPSPAAQAGASNCTDAYDQTYPCLVTHLAPEPGYKESMQIDAVDRSISHLVKIRNDGAGEVWIQLPASWQGWKFFGYWMPSQGDKCVAPGDNQPQEALDNMGSDTWSLCVR